MYAIIAENDKSQWSDDTGTLYHFPKRYATLLRTGTKVIYYKGKMKDAAFASTRLSPEPHYFGHAVIGKVYPDPASVKGDLFATIEVYKPFSSAIGIKQGTSYLERIPSNRESNYWRDGVRAVDAEIFFRILTAAGLEPPGQGLQPVEAPKPTPDTDFESSEEGSKVLRYVTTYERDPRYRRQALAIHGLRCKACDVDMGERYGAYAQGLIHVHHIVPVSTYDMPKKIDPGTDLVPVCPNCHAVIHRKKTSTLSIADVRKLLGK
jgi:putative restriction endonuclease